MKQAVGSIQCERSHAKIKRTNTHHLDNDGQLRYTPFRVELYRAGESCTRFLVTQGTWEVKNMPSCTLVVKYLI